MPRWTTILVVNAGSSSLKFEVFDRHRRPDWRAAGRWKSWAGTAPAPLTIEELRAGREDPIAGADRRRDLPGRRAARRAMARTATTARALSASRSSRGRTADLTMIAPVRHRREPACATSRMLHTACAAAPAEQPGPHLAWCMEMRPGAARRSPVSIPPSTAAISPVTDRYAHAPIDFTEQGVRRYGFHGLSYEYITRQTRGDRAGYHARGRMRDRRASWKRRIDVCPPRGRKRSRAHWASRRSTACPMGTRPGQTRSRRRFSICFAERGMSARRHQDLLYQGSGLKGLSGHQQRRARSAVKRRAGSAAGDRAFRPSVRPQAPACWRRPSAGSMPSSSRQASVRTRGRPRECIAASSGLAGRQRLMRPPTMPGATVLSSGATAACALLRRSDERRTDDRAPHFGARRLTG